MRKIKSREDISNVNTLAQAKFVLAAKNVAFDIISKDFEGYHFSKNFPGKNYGETVAGFNPEEYELYILTYESK